MTVNEQLSMLPGYWTDISCSTGFGGQRNALIAQAAEKVVDQECCFSGPKGAEESEAVRGVVAALMHELECILHEYLSFNWDRAEDIYDANKKLLEHSGDLPRLWKSGPNLHVSQVSHLKSTRQGTANGLSGACACICSPFTVPANQD